MRRREGSRKWWRGQVGPGKGSSWVAGVTNLQKPPPNEPFVGRDWARSDLVSETGWTGAAELATALRPFSASLFRGVLWWRLYRTCP